MSLDHKDLKDNKEPPQGLEFNSLNKQAFTPMPVSTVNFDFKKIYLEPIVNKYPKTNTSQDQKIREAFQKQFNELLNAFIKWIKENEKDEDKQKHLIRNYESLRKRMFDKDNTDLEPELFFTMAKQNLEYIFTQLHNEAHTVNKKLETIKKFSNEFDKCIPGIYTYIDSAAEELNPDFSVERCLALHRTRIIDAAAGKYILARKISEGNQIHVNKSLYKLAFLEKLNPSVTTVEDKYHNLTGLDDNPNNKDTIKEDFFKNETNPSRMLFNKYFIEQYTPKNIIADLMENFNSKLNDILKAKNAEPVLKIVANLDNEEGFQTFEERQRNQISLFLDRKDVKELISRNKIDAKKLNNDAKSMSFFFERQDVKELIEKNKKDLISFIGAKNINSLLERKDIKDLLEKKDIKKLKEIKEINHLLERKVIKFEILIPFNLEIYNAITALLTKSGIYSDNRPQSILRTTDDSENSSFKIDQDLLKARITEYCIDKNMFSNYIQYKNEIYFLEDYTPELIPNLSIATIPDKLQNVLAFPEKLRTMLLDKIQDSSLIFREKNYRVIFDLIKEIGKIVDAIREGNVKYLESLSWNIFKGNLPAYGKTTYLGIALNSETPSLATIKYLLENGASVNDSSDNVPPLQISMMNYFKNKTKENLEIFRYILARKDLEINKVTDNEKLSALHLAAQEGDLQIVKELLDKKADVNLQTSSKKTALHFAYNNPVIIAELLKNKPKFQPDESKMYSHDYAFKYGELESFKLIREYVKTQLRGGDPMQTYNDKGYTPIHVLISSPETPKQMEMLSYCLETKESLKFITQKTEETALHLAVRLNKVNFAKALIQKGADINAKDNKGKSPAQLIFEDEKNKELALQILEMPGKLQLDDHIINKVLTEIMLLTEETNDTFYKKFLERIIDDSGGLKEINKKDSFTMILMIRAIADKRSILPQTFNLLINKFNANLNSDEQQQVLLECKKDHNTKIADFDSELLKLSLNKYLPDNFYSSEVTSSFRLGILQGILDKNVVSLFLAHPEGTKHFIEHFLKDDDNNFTNTLKSKMLASILKISHENKLDEKIAREIFPAIEPFKDLKAPEEKKTSSLNSKFNLFRPATKIPTKIPNKGQVPPIVKK